MGIALTIVIRPAEVRDYAAYARLFPELESQDILTMPARWESHECPHTIVAEAGGQVVGYLLWTAHEGNGHIGQLVVDPEWRRRRVATQLLFTAARQLRAIGCSSWTINVKATNAGALRLYERLGFRRESIRHELAVPWDAERRLHYNRAPARVAPAGRSDDAGLARQFHVDPSVMVRHRRESPENLVFFVGDEHRRVVGMCAFAPETSYCRVLRVRHPVWAAPLIAEMGDYRERGAKKFLVELDDSPLCAALCRAGARSVLSIIYLGGVIPRGAVL